MYKNINKTKLNKCNNKEGTNMIERTTIIVSKETSAKLEGLKSSKNSSKERVILDLIDENERLKKIINSNEKPAIAFKLFRNMNNNYDILGHLIEKNTLKELRCIRDIEDKNFAKYMFELLENYWDNHRKIIRFVNQKKIRVRTKYCEFHDIEELDGYFEKFMNNNCNNDLEKIKRNVEKSYQNIENIHILLKELSDEFSKIKELKNE